MSGKRTQNGNGKPKNEKDKDNEKSSEKSNVDGSFALAVEKLSETQDTLKKSLDSINDSLYKFRRHEDAVEKSANQLELATREFSAAVRPYHADVIKAADILDKGIGAMREMNISIKNNVNDAIGEITHVIIDLKGLIAQSYERQEISYKRQELLLSSISGACDANRIEIEKLKAFSNSSMEEKNGPDSSAMAPPAFDSNSQEATASQAIREAANATSHSLEKSESPMAKDISAQVINNQATIKLRLPNAGESGILVLYQFVNENGSYINCENVEQIIDHVKTKTAEATRSNSESVPKDAIGESAEDNDPEEPGESEVDLTAVF